MNDSNSAPQILTGYLTFPEPVTSWADVQEIYVLMAHSLIHAADANDTDTHVAAPVMSSLSLDKLEARSAKFKILTDSMADNSWRNEYNSNGKYENRADFDKPVFDFNNSKGMLFSLAALGYVPESNVVNFDLRFEIVKLTTI